MLGALIGDYAGSRFEFTRYRIPYDFTFYEERNRFTDDTVMSIAVAEAIMNNKGKTTNTTTTSRKSVTSRCCQVSFFSFSSLGSI
jgi:type I restriction enzyme M protein